MSAFKQANAAADLVMCYTTRMNTRDNLPLTGHGDQCEIKRILSLLGDMWTLMIVYTLLSGARRFGELLQALGNVSPKTVSQRLKTLEEARLVERHAYAEIPPRVEYTLTEKGQGLAGILDAMRAYQERYLTGDGEASTSDELKILTPVSASSSLNTPTG